MWLTRVEAMTYQVPMTFDLGRGLRTTGLSKSSQFLNRSLWSSRALHFGGGSGFSGLSGLPADRWGHVGWSEEAEEGWIIDP